MRVGVKRNEQKRPGIINEKTSTAEETIETTAERTKRKFSRRKPPQLHLTRYNFRKLLFASTAAAIDFAPSSPIWL